MFSSSSLVKLIVFKKNKKKTLHTLKSKAPNLPFGSHITLQPKTGCPLKLSRVEPGQYLDGRPPRKTSGTFPLHGTVRLGTVRLSSGRFAFPLQFSSGGQSTQIKYLSKSTDTYNKILLQ